MCKGNSNCLSRAFASLNSAISIYFHANPVFILKAKHSALHCEDLPLQISISLSYLVSLPSILNTYLIFSRIVNFSFQTRIKTAAKHQSIQ